MEKSISVIGALEKAYMGLRHHYADHWIITGEQSDECLSAGFPALFKQRDYLAFMEPHSHPGLEMSLVLDGHGAIQIGEHVKPVQIAQVCIIPPLTRHREFYHKDFHYLALWIKFEQSAVRLHLTEKKEDREISVTVCQKLDMHHALFNMILHDISVELRNQGKWMEETVKSDIIQLLIMIIRNMVNSHADFDSESAHDQWKEILAREIISFLEVNHQSAFTLHEIAQSFSFSPNYLNGIFKSVTGKTISNYYNDYKIMKAKELLSSSDMQIKTLAVHLGYYDQFHFSKVFKKICGMTPTEYRLRLNRIE